MESAASTSTDMIQYIPPQPPQRFVFSPLTPVAQFFAVGPGWAQVKFAAVPIAAANDD